MRARPLPLTIVHVVFSSRIAGGEQHCIDLAHAQAALGHRVVVVGPAVSAIPGALGSSVRYVGLALPVLRGARLRRLVHQLRADVCHGHLGPACRAVAKTRACTRVGTLHVGFRAHQHAALDGLICVNRAQQAQLAGYGGSFRVIHNWAPLREVSLPAPDLRAELNLSPEQLLVGAVGRLDPSKGMDLLITAFRQFAPAEAVLAILGEGKQRSALEALAGADPRIKLLGFRTDVDTALQAMDLFVSPSREDAFPLAILEAMRCGLPIIASQTQGPLEMLAGQPAQLVAVADVPALGLALQQQLAQLGETPRAARPRFTYDMQPYDRTKAVQDVLEFYEQVSAQRAGLSMAALARAPQSAAHA